MKRLFAIAAAVLAVFFMSSCEKDGDSTTAASLVGTWEVTMIESIVNGVPIGISADVAGINAGISFFEDGIGCFYEDGSYEMNVFTYTYSKGKLTLYSEYDGTVTLPVTVKGNKMTISLDESMTGEPGVKGKIYLEKQ